MSAVQIAALQDTAPKIAELDPIDRQWNAFVEQCAIGDVFPFGGMARSNSTLHSDIGPISLYQLKANKSLVFYRWSTFAAGFSVIPSARLLFAFTVESRRRARSRDGA